MWKVPGVVPPGSRVLKTTFVKTILALIVTACASQGPVREVRRTLPTDYVPGSFVVSTYGADAESSLSESSAAVARSHGCQVSAPQRINWGEAAVLSDELRNTFNLSFANCDFSPSGTQRLIDELAGASHVASVSAEAMAAVAPIQEDDPYKSTQEHLAFIGRDLACERANVDSEPVIVAVLDSGVDVDHPDLQSAFLRDARGEIIGANFVGSGAAMPHDRDFDDRNGHGTHVAGIIGAAAGNGLGVVGVGSCAHVKIMPVRVLGVDGKGSMIEIERGIKWAADRGAHIINLSLGYRSSVWGGRFNHPLFGELARRNVVVLAAAGNEGRMNGVAENDGVSRWNFPASHDHVIAVAATDEQGQLTSFSNRGDRVDIAAPGQRIVSTTMGGGYGRMSGTSMATPVVAGAYALALSAARPRLSLEGTQGGSRAGSDRRIDVQVARDLLSQAVLSRVSLPTVAVASGGVLDAAALVRSVEAKYPFQDEQQTETDDAELPTEPNFEDEEPQPLPPPIGMQVPFEFADLRDGQQAGAPQALKMRNLPQGTTMIYFYWGSARYHFSKVSVPAAATAHEVVDDVRWYFSGTATLMALAVDARGRVLSEARVRLRGH